MWKPPTTIFFTLRLRKVFHIMSRSTTSFDEIKKGEFKRTASTFRDWVKADGSTEFTPEKNRYVLYICWACPWASRCMAYRKLKGLEDVIDYVAVQPEWGPLDATEAGETLTFESDSAARNILKVEKHKHSWVFPSSEETAVEGSSVDKYNQARTVRQLYEKADSNYSGKYTVPVLWDLKNNTIVNNESAEITQMLNSEFNEFAKYPERDFLPKDLIDTIHETNDWMYNTINNGVYRCGFAQTQEAYDKAFKELFTTLDEAEERLGKTRFINGNRFTDSDIRLFVTAVRFDAVYLVHFKCNLRRIEDYPNLRNWLRDVYQIPGVSSTVLMHQIKRHYYGSHPFINPYLVVPNGPDIDFSTSHNRLELFDGDIFKGE